MNAVGILNLILLIIKILKALGWTPDSENTHLEQLKGDVANVVGRFKGNDAGRAVDKLDLSMIEELENLA